MARALTFETVRVNAKTPADFLSPFRVLFAYFALESPPSHLVPFVSFVDSSPRLR